MQNLRGGHYDITADLLASHRLCRAFDQLTMAG